MVFAMLATGVVLLARHARGSQDTGDIMSKALCSDLWGMTYCTAITDPHVLCVLLAAGLPKRGGVSWVSGEAEWATRVIGAFSPEKALDRHKQVPWLLAQSP